MRVAGLVLGIMGAIAGFIGAIVALTIGSIGAAFGDNTVVLLGLAGLGACIVGLVGAALSMAKPRLAASLMLVSAIVGVIAISYAYILATVLLVIGAVLTFLGRKERAGQAG